MNTRDSRLLGCPVSDYTTGQLLGWVKAVAVGATPASIAGIVVDRHIEEAHQDAGTPFALTEAEPQPHHDYMIGQTSTVTIHDPAGGLIVVEGGLITCQVLHHARRCGLLHRLNATFRRK